MVKKEVYLQFGNRNKCITFESKSGISDWNNLREVMRQTAKKDEDLKRRLQNCNIIFQKYKIKKSTGERILVDVDEYEESEVEHDADLAVVFCHLKDISKNQASENEIQVQDVFSMQSSNPLFLDLSTDVLKCHKILNDIESNDVNIGNLNDEIVETYEIIDKNEESINLEMRGTVTIKPTESSPKRKLNTKSKPEKVRYLKFLHFIFVDIM